jgi:hypothetical protein
MGLSKKAKCLMKGILKDVKVLVCEKLDGAMRTAQLKEIKDAIEEMKDMVKPG